ncbi:MAG: tRNA (guanosine(46)-N7)-methyltransferase TrmB [Flavobacteriaceae bacterium]|nr:tRNA (guanosine(46)-N7)-methyltransferase TrmB [Flavobacteriaceae bacterium]RCL66076.1 MAG: tRNA (guanosine(46)-N7)-methyltransferase TrmB [Cryomorphaceae bacterium]
MGSKNKLKRFIQNESFSNVIQPKRQELLSKNFNYKGNWNSLHFKNNNPIIIELGCGRGEYTVNLAKLNPDKNYIGIDIKGARFWRGAKTSIDEKLDNVAFLRTQIELINLVFGKDEVDEIWLTFPDPQIKYQRTKHRLTNPFFINLYKKILKNKGIVHLKTDSEFLHGYTLGILKSFNINLIFSNHDIYKNNNAPDEVINIKTHYEKLFLESNKNISYLSFTFHNE